MAAVTFEVTRHEIITPDVSYIPGPGKIRGYATITCYGNDGHKYVMVFLRPDCAWPSDYADYAASPVRNCYMPASKLAVSYLEASQFQRHVTLLEGGKTVYAFLDSDYPKSNRIYVADAPLIVTTDIPPNLHELLATQYYSLCEYIVWFTKDGYPLTYPQWSSTQQAELQAAFEAAWNHVPIPLSDPPSNICDYDLMNITVIPEDDGWRLYIAHVAQCLAVEIGKWVPWSLLDYSREDLKRIIFSSSILVWSDINNGYEICNDVVPAPPYKVYEFFVNNNLIQYDRLHTIASVLDWCRNLFHWSNVIGGTIKKDRHGGLLAVSRLPSRFAHSLWHNKVKQARGRFTTLYSRMLVYYLLP